MRRSRFFWVFMRAGLLFGVLFGLVGGGLVATLIGVLFRESGVHRWPTALLIPGMILATGIPFGLLLAAADAQFTRKTPEDRLDPTGAVRQRITLEVPVPPEAVLEAISRIVFEDLGWAIEDRATGHLKLRVPPSLRSFGEQVTIDLHPTPSGSAVLIYSRPLSVLVTVDYNKNRDNALKLREKLLNKVGRAHLRH